MDIRDFTLVDAPSDVELWSEAQAFNDNRTPYPRDRTVHALFSEQAARTPRHLFVLGEERGATYAELEARSNRLARVLAGAGVGPGALVAVAVERIADLAAALLGILKAGAAYVPIDDHSPYDRVRRVLTNGGIHVLVGERRSIRMLNRLQWDCPALETLLVIDSDDAHAELESPGGMMNEEIWDDMGRWAFDAISGGGWTDSYTGEWLSREVMDAYAGNVAAKLRPYLTPETRVLEIGCASGLSLRGLAPYVARYVGTDLSSQTLAWAGKYAAEQGLTGVRLRHLAAHDIDRLDEADFDLVVLNSVVQCFPGHNYLRDVLRKAARLMRDRGVIFLGNLWDQDRKDDFVRSLAAFAHEHAGKGYRTKVDRAEELFVSRRFLEDLRHDVPGLGAMEYSLMLGTAESELSRVGYDAIAPFDRRAPAPPARRHKRQVDRRSLDLVSDAALDERASPNDVACVIYTSGTTGEPKGAMIPHRAIARLVLDTNFISLTDADRCLQTGSLAFDASFLELWGMWLNGGAVRRADRSTLFDPAAMKRRILEDGVTTMFLTTSVFNHLVDIDDTVVGGLTTLIVGGERASTGHFMRVRRREPRLRLLNGYGPTENTTFTTTFQVDAIVSGDLPIGRPVANTEVLIFDAEMKLVPTGVLGEIYAGGDGLACGYLNDPALTAQKFVPHPFRPGERLYRTGDLGRWRADGVVEYAGRVDDQVKIRGFRVELGEIEARLRAQPGVRQVAVTASQPGAAPAELTAYFTADGDADVAVLREALGRALPDYMVPARLIQLARFPLTANGKVDRAALPDPGRDRPDRSAAYVPPESETERALVEIWERELELTGVGVIDNFFDLGGHSLKAFKVMSSIETRLGVNVPLTALFRHATIRNLAAAVVDHARFGAAIADDPVVCLGEAGGPAVFAFPPGLGDAAGYIQVAQALRQYALHAFNFVEAATRLQDYAALIAASGAPPPYVLLGYSSGGNLAYHVARVLEERGDRVSAIVMIDSGVRLKKNPYPPELVRRLADDFLDQEELRSYVPTSVLREKAHRRITASLAWAGNVLDDHCVQADIHLVCCPNAPDQFRDEAGDLVSSKADWARLTRGAFIRQDGHGDHGRMLAEPNLSRNVAVVREILNTIFKETVP